MNTSFVIDIAGTHIACICNHEKLGQVLSQRYRGFLTDGQAHFTIKIIWEKSDDSHIFTPPVITFNKDGLRMTGPGYTGAVNFTEQAGDLMIYVASPVEVIDYFLRVVTALLIFDARGILIHGAGILHQGGGYLFFGHSGSGKTTVSRLSIHDVILNDDLVILMPSDIGWKMYSTPFWNPSQLEPKPVTALLIAMYSLVQSKTVFISSFKLGQALAELVANIPVISSDSKRSHILIDRCMSLLQNTPAYQLHFLPDDSFWQTIQAHREHLA